MNQLIDLSRLYNCLADATTRPWRAGRKVFRTLYTALHPSDDGKLIGCLDHAEDTALIVEVVNSLSEILKELETWRSGHCPICDDYKCAGEKRCTYPEVGRLT